MFSMPDRPTGSTSKVQSGRPAVRPSDRRVSLNRWAGAHQVAIPERRIDAADGWPDLVLACGCGRETSALARIRPVPILDQQIRERMRRVLQQIAVAVGLAVLDLPNLPADRDERVDETIELGLGLALGRLDHQRARDGEG